MKCTQCGRKHRGNPHLCSSCQARRDFKQQVMDQYDALRKAQNRYFLSASSASAAANTNWTPPFSATVPHGQRTITWSSTSAIPERLPEPEAEPVAAPVTGYRVWKIDPGAPYLLSSLNDEQWIPGREARCGIRTAGMTSDPAAHGCPHWGRECGYWAFKGRDSARSKAETTQMFGQRPGKPYAFGEVEMWGKVIECSDGYRAQYMRPVSLELMGVDDATRQRLQALWPSVRFVSEYRYIPADDAYSAVLRNSALMGSWNHYLNAPWPRRKRFSRERVLGAVYAGIGGSYVALAASTGSKLYAAMAALWGVGAILWLAVR